MKVIKSLNFILLLDLLLIILLFSLPFYKLYGSSYYFILKIIFVVIILNSLLLFIFLKKMADKYLPIGRYFKPLLLVFSIILIVAIGQLHLMYLHHFVIPDSLYCNYYDEYNYKIYYSDSNSCPELKVLK